MSTLLEIEDDLYALEDLLTQASDDVDDDAFAALSTWQGEIEGDFNTKVQRIAHVIETLEARANARRAKVAELSKLAKYDDASAERLKRYVLDAMRRQGVSRIDTDTGRITRAGNGGKLPLVIDEEKIPAIIPEEVRKVTIDVDRTALREMLESGRSYDFASLGERGEHLKIK